MSHILSGSELAKKIRDELKSFIFKHDLRPSLGIILVGEDPASKLYVGLKEKAAKEIGITLHTYRLPTKTTQEELDTVVEFLNNDETVDAILIQLPLPSHLNDDATIKLMNAQKDVDGFHPDNLSALMKHEHHNFPGLIEGILQLIESAKQPLEHKKALIIANSEIFAKPLEHALVHMGLAVRIIDANDDRLVQSCQEADVIVTAVGKKWFIDESMVRDGSILIDVGTVKDGDKTYGDINPNVDNKKVYRSPVPGGVGPMTIAMLLKNTLQLHINKNS